MVLMNKVNQIDAASITYILETESDFPVSKSCMNFYFILTLILLFISSDTFYLVILFRGGLI